METKSISTEVINFLASSGVTAALLAREAGISPVIVSRLKTGGRKEVRSSTADRIRAAMRRLSPSTPAPAPPAGADGGA